MPKKKSQDNKSKKSKEKLIVNLDEQKQEPSNDKVWESMSFLQKQEDKTEKINAERLNAKNVLVNNLLKLNFAEDEISQVMQIVTETEKNIQFAKDSLIGTNINNDDPTVIMHKIFEEIRRLQAEMAVKVRHKIYEIQLSKTDPEKYAELMAVTSKPKKSTKSKKKV